MRLTPPGCLDNRADWFFHPHLGIGLTLMFALLALVVGVQQVQTMKVEEWMEYIAS